MRLARLALAAASSLLLLGIAPAAQALPFHGYNSVHYPCGLFTTGTPGSDSTNPPSCIGNTELNWFGNRPTVYRFEIRKSDWAAQSASYKTAISRMRAHNVEPFVILGPGGNAAPPALWNEQERVAFYSWARTVAQQLSQSPYNVQDYEVFNEVNVDYPGHREEYAKLYCYVAGGIRDSGSGARVYLGGVGEAPLYNLQFWVSGVKYYIDRDCASIRIDGVSYHPYGRNPDTNQNGWKLALDLYYFRHEVLNPNGLAGAMIMATEIGYSGGTTTASKDLQKRQLMTLFDVCWSARHSYYVRGCYWYPILDYPPAPPGINRDGGLVEAVGQGQPRPAFWEFQNRLVSHP